MAWVLSKHHWGVPLFCGDSGNYFAHMVGPVGIIEGRLEGFPWLLKSLGADPRSPRLIVALQNGLMLAAHVLFLWYSRESKRNRPGVLPLVLGAAVFFEPHLVRIESMAYMPDAFCCFLLVVVFGQVGEMMRRSSSWAGAIVMGGALAGLTLCKLVFLPWVLSFGFGIGLFCRVQRIRGWKVVFGMALGIPIAAQAVYLASYRYPLTGHWDIDRFGGFSALANLLPHGTCADWADGVAAGAERDSVLKRCSDVELKRGGQYLMWSTGSANPLWSVRTDLGLVGGSVRRIETYGRLGGWGLKVASRHPGMVLRAMGENLDLFWQGTLGVGSFQSRIVLGRDCRRLLDEVYPRGGARGYELDYVSWSVRRQGELEAMDQGFGTWFMVLARMSLLVPFFMIVFILKRLWHLVFLTLVSTFYLGLVLVGGTYDPRYYGPYLLLSLMLMALWLSTPKLKVEALTGVV